MFKFQPTEKQSKINKYFLHNSWNSITREKLNKKGWYIRLAIVYF